MKPAKLQRKLYNHKLAMLGFLVSMSVIFYSRDIKLLASTKDHNLKFSKLINERILHPTNPTRSKSIGNYTIANTSAASVACEGINIRTYNDASAISGDNESLSSYFTSGRHLLEQYLVTEDSSDLSSYISSVIVSFMFSILMVVFSLMNVIYLCSYFLCFQCCCECCLCCCCKKRPEAPDYLCCGSTGWSIAIYWINIVLSLCCLTFSIVWIVYYGNMCNNIDLIFCSIQSVFNDIINGVNDIGTGLPTQFAGVSGFVWHLKQMQTELENTRAVTDVTDLYNLDMKLQSGLVNPSLTKFYNNFVNSNVNSPNDGVTKIIPDRIQDMTNTISTTIGAEANIIVTMGNEMGQAADTLKSLDTSAGNIWTDLKAGLQSAIVSFGVVQKRLQEYNDKVSSKNPNTMKGLLFTIGVIVFCCVTFCLFYFWATTFCLKFLKCKTCCRCMGKSMVIVFAIIAFIICLICIIFLIQSSVLTDSCSLTYNLVTDKNWYAKIKPAEVDMIKFFGACMYNSTYSSGSIQDALPDSAKPYFVKATGLYKAFHHKDNYEAHYSSIGLTEPVTSTSYINRLNDEKVFNTNGFRKIAVVDRYTTVIGNLNTLLVCTQNTWVMTTSDCPTFVPIWTITDSETYQATAPICIVVSQFLVSNSLTARYAGTCASANSASAQQIATNLNNFETDFTTLVNNIIGGSGTNGQNDPNQYNTLSKALLSKVGSSVAHWVSVEQILPDFVGFIDNFYLGLRGYLNCTYIRSGMVIISNAVCYNWVSNWNQQSIWFALLGHFMVLMSMCMCAGYRCPYKEQARTGVPSNINNVFPQDIEPPVALDAEYVEAPIPDKNQIIYEEKMADFEEYAKRYNFLNLIYQLNFRPTAFGIENKFNIMDSKDRNTDQFPENNGNNNKNKITSIFSRQYN